MAFSMACRDTGPDCPATFTTETEDELMVHAEMHALVQHPELKLDDAALQMLKGVTKQV